MQERLRGLLIIFSAGFLIIIIPAIFISLHKAPIDSYTQSISGVITPTGQYAANVTISTSLYENSIINVTSISSNTSGDNPTASRYNPTGKVLEISGLMANSTHTLTIQYGVSGAINSWLPGLSSVLIAIAWIFILAGIGLLVAGMLTIFKVI